MRYFWGFFLVLIGVIILGLNFSWWTSQDLDKLVDLWPVLIILLGIAFMVRRLSFGWVIILLSIIVALLFAYNVAFSPHPILKTSRISSSQTNEFSAPLPNAAKNGKVTINTGAVELNLNQTSSEFVAGTLDSSFAKPSLTTKNNDGSLTANLETKGSNGTVSRVKNILDVRLSDQIPLDVAIKSGASTLNLDLKQLILSKLSIDVGASSINLDLGEKVENNAEITVAAGASSIDITIPESVGAKVISNSPVSSANFQNFNKDDNNTYISKGYDTTTKKITIKINAGVSSINVKHGS